MIDVFVSKPLEFATSVYKDKVDTYKDYYKHLECGTFDVVRVIWAGQEISLFVDDEGMLKSGNFGRRVEGYPEPLFGTIVVTGGVDEEGETLGVPDEINIMDIGKYIGEIEYVVT